MSRNKNVDYTQFVHEYADSSGNTRYAVARWAERAAQFQWPLDSQTADLTGCHAGFCQRAADCDNRYRDRTKALRRARYLFGYIFE